MYSLRSQTAQIEILALTVTSYIMLGKFFNFFLPHFFPMCDMGIIKHLSPGLFSGLSKWIHYWTYSKHSVNGLCGLKII